MNYYDTTINQPTAIILAANVHNKLIDYEISELIELAKANNIHFLKEFVQPLDRINPKSYLGSGKLEEIKNYVELENIDLVICNDEITPTQIRNIEQILNVPTIDRTRLILNIFADRAQTKQAKLQVELATMQYQLPRLHSSLIEKYDQQTGSGGGSFTSRGAGEKKIELKKRNLQNKISQLKKELAKLENASNIQSDKRKSSSLLNVSLIGYTNAGKSTIFNQLISNFSKQKKNNDKTVLQKDMLFATLAPTVRKIHFQSHQEILLTDTVGFVSKLPHNLVESFKSTLSEAKNADLLIHVVDYSDPNHELMIKTTEEVLNELGITNIPTLLVYNKCDLAKKIDYPSQIGKSLYISAIKKDSILLLTKQIETFIEKINNN